MGAATAEDRLSGLPTTSSTPSSATSRCSKPPAPARSPGGGSPVAARARLLSGHRLHRPRLRPRPAAGAGRSHGEPLPPPPRRARPAARVVPCGAARVPDGVGRRRRVRSGRSHRVGRGRRGEGCQGRGGGPDAGAGGPGRQRRPRYSAFVVELPGDLFLPRNSLERLALAAGSASTLSRPARPGSRASTHSSSAMPTSPTRRFRPWSPTAGRWSSSA
jgi:hypothetical protein